MDVKRIRRPQPTPPSRGREGAFRAWAGRKPSTGTVSPGLVLVACLMLLALLFVASGARRSQYVDALVGAGGVEGSREFRTRSGNSSEDASFISARIEKAELLGGLLVAGFDEQSCLSRYQSMLYRKGMGHPPSSYLVQRLRHQEALQKKCGPGTELYKKAVEQLNSGHGIETSNCKYIVWISYSGLGNRILTLASAFLYAVLTNRVLLIDRGKDMDDLFCEPFPETSWFLPPDFPITSFKNFSIETPESYGNMLKSKAINNAGSTPSFIYLHLDHDYNDYDKLFFCDSDQLSIQRVPWLVLRSDNYFVPSLFLIPTYQEELCRLFPKKDTVFHHLGHYLFHPTNAVWGLITRYYQSYLADAEERVGIQIRVFDSGSGPFQHVLDQILSCSLKEKLLPETTTQKPNVLPRRIRRTVLVTSLNSGYYERIRDMYWEYPTANGEIVSVHQPSHEGHQQSEKKRHNMKALAEMYLLSSADILVTSAWSTFGYVAQGLGGLKPWILLKPENLTAPDPPCRRAASMEPCFHAPPFYDCEAKKGVDTGKLVPHVRHCEDVSWGLKLVDDDQR